MGAKLLEEVGCDLDRTRLAVRERLGNGPAEECAQDEMPLTPRLKKVLELAVDEATRLDHSYVGTEHLVLGLLREGDGVAGRLLNEVGMDLSAARRRAREIVSRQAER